MRLAAALLLLGLAGCAGFDGHNLKPGQSTLAELEATMGKPALVRDLPAGEKLYWYPRLPFGRASYAARVAPDGRLVSLEQRLAPEHIVKIRPNQSTVEDVLDILGPPSEVYRYARQQREVWEYPLHKPPTRPLLFVQFSPDKVVREVYEIDERLFNPWPELM
jgi:hypothetical protein